MKTNVIKSLREQRGMSQQQLADAVQPATTQSQIDRLEKGERRLTDDWMKRLAKPLGVKAEIFVMTTNYDTLLDETADLETVSGGTAPNRIREQREKKGLSQADLAEKCATTKQQIGRLEAGRRKLSRVWLTKIAKALEVRVVDLLPSDPNIRLGATPVHFSGEEQPLRESAVIEEVDVRISSGDGALAESEDSSVVVAEWQMPAEFVRSHTSTPAERIKIVPVHGDSMSPDFLPGERIMVDTEDKRPSPPGVFIVWDGLGLVMKRVEVIPNSNPIMVRLIPRNPQYQTYERPLADVHINARVIGKWART